MTTRDTMNEDDRRRLVELLAAYGADPQRWPDADRQRLAHQLSTHDPTDVAQAAALDSLLSDAVAPPLPEGATERLLARVKAARPAPVVATSRRNWFAAPAAALAASLLLGLWIGAGGGADGLLLDPKADHDWSAIDLQTTDDGDAA